MNVCACLPSDQCRTHFNDAFLRHRQFITITAFRRVTFRAVFLRADATTEEVYDLLGPLARTAVDEARAHRKRLSDNRVLMGLKAVMSSAEATAFGIDVLRTDEEGNFALGTFDVAPIDAKIVTLPKSAYSHRHSLSDCLRSPLCLCRFHVANSFPNRLRCLVRRF